MELKTSLASDQDSRGKRIIGLLVILIIEKIVYCGGSETPCNIARYYLMIVHCMISVLFLVYKLAYFGIHLTNTVSVFSA